MLWKKFQIILSLRIQLNFQLLGIQAIDEDLILKISLEKVTENAQCTLNGS